MRAARLRGQRRGRPAARGRRSSRCRTCRVSCRCRPLVAGCRPGAARTPSICAPRSSAISSRCASATEPACAGLEEAMRYSLLAGGKRIRPVLALATAERDRHEPRVRAAAGGRDRADPHLLADPRRPASDGRRRPAPRAARPATVAFGEDVAILAGDGLYAEAFRAAADRAAGRAAAECSPPAAELARATGRAGDGRRAVHGRRRQRAARRRGAAPPARAEDRPADRREHRVRTC